MTAGLQPDPTSSRILIVIVALGNKVISSSSNTWGDGNGYRKVEIDIGDRIDSIQLEF